MALLLGSDYTTASRCGSSTAMEIVNAFLAWQRRLSRVPLVGLQRQLGAAPQAALLQGGGRRRGAAGERERVNAASVARYLSSCSSSKHRKSAVVARQPGLPVDASAPAPSGPTWTTARAAELGQPRWDTSSPPAPPVTAERRCARYGQLAPLGAPLHPPTPCGGGVCSHDRPCVRDRRARRRRATGGQEGDDSSQGVGPAQRLRVSSTLGRS